jgi:hypothetical protein
MKKLIITMIASLGLVTGTSQAEPNHYRGYGYREHTDWLAPLVIGGVVGYALTRPQQVIIQQPQVVYPNPYPPVPYGYHYEQLLDANCNCYRMVLVQNQP